MKVFRGFFGIFAVLLVSALFFGCGKSAEKMEVERLRQDWYAKTDAFAATLEKAKAATLKAKELAVSYIADPREETRKAVEEAIAETKRLLALSKALGKDADAAREALDAAQKKKNL